MPAGQCDWRQQVTIRAILKCHTVTGGHHSVERVQSGCSSALAGRKPSKTPQSATQRLAEQPHNSSSRRKHPDTACYSILFYSILCYGRETAWDLPRSQLVYLLDSTVDLPARRAAEPGNVVDGTHSGASASGFIGGCKSSQVGSLSVSTLSLLYVLCLSRRSVRAHLAGEWCHLQIPRWARRAPYPSPPMPVVERDSTGASYHGRQSRAGCCWGWQSLYFSIPMSED